MTSHALSTPFSSVNVRRYIAVPRFMNVSGIASKHPGTTIRPVGSNAGPATAVTARPSSKRNSHVPLRSSAMAPHTTPAAAATIICFMFIFLCPFRNYGE